MPQHARLDVYNAMLATGLVPLFYHADAAVAEAVMQACVAGGARLVEFTNRGEAALATFTHLNQHRADGCILGVGSVFDAPTAALFMAHGADFIVSPVFNPKVARLCNRHKVAYLPGCATPSEISRAEEYGAEIVKVFPATTVGGPDFIRAVRGPSPWTRIMPTGGIKATEEDVTRWVEAGAACLGLGSGLLRKAWISAGRYDDIAALVGRTLEWISEARG